MIRPHYALLVFLLAGRGLLPGQETRSTIYGRVLDPQAAVVSGADVVVANTDTNTAISLKTNQTGYYEATLLLPGNYQITVEMTGFKKYVRSGILLPVSTRMEINAQLEIGGVSETVSVVAGAPLVDANSAAAGRVLDNRTVNDLPVIWGNPLTFVKFTSGVWYTGNNSTVSLHGNNAGSDYSAPGGVGGNEWSVDGVPNNGSSRRVAYLPSAETVQEFKVETANFDVSIGHTSGLGVSMMTKAGTNQFHGALVERHKQQRWTGAPFFAKQFYYRQINDAAARGDSKRAEELRSQPILPSGRLNDYVGTLGGPVVLPKIYDGRNRLFFFFSYNGYIAAQREEPGNMNRDVPTSLNRRGDFSDLLAVDPVRYQIHDPLSVRPDPARPTHYIRDPFPGNVLPQSRLVNPVYNFYSKIMPMPNNPPRDPKLEPRNNYLATGIPWTYEYSAIGNRVDYHHSDRHRFFTRWSWNDFYEKRSDWTYETMPGLHENGLVRQNLGATADWVYTGSATTVLDFAVAVNEYREGNHPAVPFRFKPSDVGLPKYLDEKAADQHILPQMSFAGYETIGIGGVPVITRYRTSTQKLDANLIRGNHTLRLGVDLRQHFRTGGGGGNTSGNFGFNNSFTRRHDDGFTPAGDLGHSWAAFLMGLPNSMSIAENDSYATANPYYAWYVQDTWRLTRKLTLTLGLRTEYELGPTERYNRMISYFDQNTKLPISDAAEAAYARRPLAERPASDFRIRGGAVYPGVNGVSRALWDAELMWLPRLAAAYQVNPKTVLRGGYGLFYDTLNVLNFGPAQNGFSRTTSTILTTDFGMTWRAGDPRNGVSPLTDPFPVRADGTRFDTPTRTALGNMAVAGRGFSFSAFDRKHARQQRVRAGIQRQLGGTVVIEAAYSGSFADRVYISRNLSVLPEKYWADGLVRNNAIANDLNSNLPNPFQISNFADLQKSNPVVYQDMTTQSLYTSSTIRKERLLRPFPHMSSLAQSNAPLGRMRTHSFELSLEKRFSKGFNFYAGFTRLKAREAVDFFNDWEAEPFWRESNNGRPYRFVSSAIYELPFGKGKPFASSGLWSALFGGFQISVTYEYQPGVLLDWGNLFYYGDIQDIGKGPRTLDRWFNTDNFERSAAKGPAAFHRRVFPTRVDGVRADCANWWNGNVQREFRFKERFTFQFRVDALNLVNRSQFSGPNRDPFSTNFGRVTSTTSAPNRMVQIQGRFQF